MHRVLRLFTVLLLIVPPNLDLLAGEEPAESYELNNKDVSTSESMKNEPGFEYERLGERLEARDEVISAISNYGLALLELTKSKNVNRNDALRFMFLSMKIHRMSVDSHRYGIGAPCLEKALDNVEQDNSSWRKWEYIIARLRWYLADLKFYAGNLVSVHKETERLGFIRRYVLDDGIKKRIIYNDNPRGEIYLGDFIPDKKNKKAILHFALVSDRKANIKIGIGSNCSYTLLCKNVELLTEKKRNASYSYAEYFDQRAIQLKLGKGRNVFSIEFKETPSDSTFNIRVCNVDGTALPDGVEFVNPAAEKETETPTENDMGPIVCTVPLQLLSNTTDEKKATARKLYYFAALGQAFDRQLLLPRIQKAVTDAILKEPHSPLMRILYARILLHGGYAVLDNEASSAIRQLELATMVKGQKVLALTELARLLSEYSNLNEKALSIVDKALTENPLSSSAASLKIGLLSQLHLNSEWRVFAQNFLKRNPISHRVQSSLLGKNKKYATGLIERAAQLYPADISFAILFADKLSAEGNTQSAESILRTTLEFFPHSKLLHLSLANFFVTQRKYEKALDVLDKYTAIHGEALGFNDLKGEIESLRGDHNRAAAYYMAAAAKSRNNEDFRLRANVVANKLNMKAAKYDSNLIYKYANMYKNIKPVDSDRGVLYLLLYRATELTESDEVKNVFHQIVRIENQSGAEFYSKRAFTFNSKDKEVLLNSARVLHKNDSHAVSALITSHPYSGKTTVFFTSLKAGDIIEIKISEKLKSRGFFGENYFGSLIFFRQGVPVLESQYEVISPKSKTLVFDSQGIGEPSVQIIHENDLVSRKWTAKNLPPLPRGKYLPPSTEMSPSVVVSSFKDWEEFGKWYWHLTEPQRKCTAKITSLVARLIDNCTTDRQKVEALYSWVTTNVRNESWSVGIFGYKPYRAETVFNRRFGDCKDKSVLLNVMLRSAGLKAYPVLIKSYGSAEGEGGRGEERFNLPILNHFNHCISVVEVDGKPIFLDPTEQYFPVGAIGRRIAGGTGAIIRENGAELIKLPSLSPEENRWEDRLSLTLDRDGGASIVIAGSCNGSWRSFLKSNVRYEQNDYAMYHLSELAYGKTASASFKYMDEDNTDVAEFKAMVNISEYMKKDSDNLFRIKIPAVFIRFGSGGFNLLPSRATTLIDSISNETYLVLQAPLLLKRRINVVVPENFEFVSRLKEINIDNEYVKFAVQSQSNGGSIQLDYTFELKNRRIKNRDIKEFRRVISRLYKLESMDVYIKKK